MTTVTEIKMTSLEVGHANEHGDKHAAVVILRQEGIDLCGYIDWRMALLGDDAEQVAGNGHEQ